MPFYEREKELLEVIEKAECISMQALLKNQYTSVSTLRRDLIKLEEKGLILRTRGGVMAVKNRRTTRSPSSYAKAKSRLKRSSSHKKRQSS